MNSEVGDIQANPIPPPQQTPPIPLQQAPPIPPLQLAAPISPPQQAPLIPPLQQAPPSPPPQQAPLIPPPQPAQQDGASLSLVDNFGLYQEFLLANFCSALKIPYTHMDSAVRMQKMLLSDIQRRLEKLLIDEAPASVERMHKIFGLNSFPETIRTIFSRMKKWEPKDLFDLYVCCDNDHLYLKSSVINKAGELLRENTCTAFNHGMTAEDKVSDEKKYCGKPLLKKSSAGSDRFQPIRCAPYRGVRRGLERLFRQKWFVDGLSDWKTLPDLGSTLNDLYSGERWKSWIPWLEEDDFNVLLLLFIDG